MHVKYMWCKRKKEEALDQSWVTGGSTIFTLFVFDSRADPDGRQGGRSGFVRQTSTSDIRLYHHVGGTEYQVHGLSSLAPAWPALGGVSVFGRRGLRARQAASGRSPLGQGQRRPWPCATAGIHYRALVTTRNACLVGHDASARPVSKRSLASSYAPSQQGFGQPKVGSVAVSTPTSHPDDQRVPASAAFVA